MITFNPISLPPNLIGGLPIARGRGGVFYWELIARHAPFPYTALSYIASFKAIKAIT